MKGCMDKKKLLLGTVVLFVLLGILYFLPLEIPFKKCFPMALLFLAGFWLQSWPIIAAAFFSLAGDVMGDLHQFVPQMGFFAVAHLFYIGYFLSLGLKNKRNKGPQVKGWWFGVVTAFSVAVFYLASERIIPFAPEGVVRTGMYVYAGLITVMMWSALMQKDWMWGIGAILFVFSDSVIAINKFVSPVPDERFLIMATYYAAQLLIFVRACPAFQPSRR